MHWGVRIKSKRTNNEMNYWFDTQQQRDQFIKVFDKENYLIIEFLSEQMELNFDIR